MCQLHNKWFVYILRRWNQALWLFSFLLSGYWVIFPLGVKLTTLAALVPRYATLGAHQNTPQGWYKISAALDGQWTVWGKNVQYHLYGRLCTVSCPDPDKCSAHTNIIPHYFCNVQECNMFFVTVWDLAYHIMRVKQLLPTEKIQQTMCDVRGSR